MASLPCKGTRNKLLILLGASFLVAVIFVIKSSRHLYEKHEMVEEKGSSLTPDPPSENSTTSLQRTDPTTPEQVTTATQSVQTPRQSVQAPADQPLDVRSYFNATFHGRVPERVVVPGGGNVHFSLRTGSQSYGDRFPIVFLTWIQALPPENVNQFPPV